MLATGKSMVLSYEAMLNKGEPKHTHFVSVIASQEGVDHVKSHMGKNATLWVAALDEWLCRIHVPPTTEAEKVKSYFLVIIPMLWTQ